MGIAQAIPAELGFTRAQSLVLFHHPLPQWSVISLPPVEIPIEILDDSSPSTRKEPETFCYDRNGHMACKRGKGLLIDSYS